MGLNRFRNKPCQCGSGMKFKYCCLQDHYEQQVGLVTSLAKKIQDKTAKYFQKRYKAKTQAIHKRCESCKGSGLAHDENGCEIDDVCEGCTGSGSAVGENE